MLNWLRKKAGEMLTVKMICRDCRSDVAKEPHHERCFTGLRNKALIASCLPKQQPLEGDEQKA